jgi:hypothetical protein
MAEAIELEYGRNEYFRDNIISVYDLPLYEGRNIKCKDINYFGVIKDITLIEFIEYIEYLLLDIIDLVVKNSMSRYTRHPEFDYYLCGGKAINNAISTKYLKKSFDFDIHVDGHDINDQRYKGDSLTNLSNQITTDINQLISNPWTIFIRKQIATILLNNNIITAAEEEHYIQNFMELRDPDMIPENTLFFRGTRGLGVNIKHGLFLKLLFKDDLFYIDNNVRGDRDRPFIYTNYQGGNLRNIADLTAEERAALPAHDPTTGYAPKTEVIVGGYTREQHFTQKTLLNIIYLPFADILKETIVTNNVLGYKLFRTHNIFNSIYSTYGIKYIDYPTMISNLLNYIFLTPTKTEKNLTKLKRLLKPILFNCSYLSNNDSHRNLNTRIQNILSQLLNQSTFPNNPHSLAIINSNSASIRVNNNIPNKLELFRTDPPVNIDRSIVRILNRVFTDYVGYYDNRIINCNPVMSAQPGVVLNTAGHINFFKSRTQRRSRGSINDLKTKLEKIAHISDRNNRYHIREYTSNLYQSLNTFGINSANELSVHVIRPHGIRYQDDTQVTYSDDTNGDISVPHFDYQIDEYNNVYRSINKAFKEFHRRLRLDRDLMRDIKKIFTVYSFQDVLSYSEYGDVNYGLNGISNAKIGDKITFPKYISSTLKQNVNLSALFASNREFKTIFRIRLNKNYNNWIFLNKYSIVPEEEEILIKNNTLFNIINIDTVKINVDETDFDIKLITLEALPDDYAERNIIHFSTSLLPYLTNSYDNNVLKSDAFFRAALYVTNIFVIPYDDAAALKEFSNRNPGLYLDDDDDFKAFTDDAWGDYLDNHGNLVRLERPTHGLAHAIRVCTLIYINALNMYKYNTIPGCRDILTPTYILKLVIAGLFIISGRGSEISGGAQLPPGLPLTPEEYIHYNTGYERYTVRSANNFKTLAMEEPFNKLFDDPVEIDELADCIESYYGIHFAGRKRNGTNIISPRLRLSAILFSISRDFDLIRIRNTNCSLPINRGNIPENVFNYEARKYVNIIEKLYINTGTNIFANIINITNYNNRNVTYFPININTIPFENPTFFENSTNARTCITSALNAANEYIDDIILDIKESTAIYNYNPINLHTIPLSRPENFIPRAGFVVPNAPIIDPLIYIDHPIAVPRVPPGPIPPPGAVVYEPRPPVPLPGGGKKYINTLPYDLDSIDVEKVQNLYENLNFAPTLYLPTGKTYDKIEELSKNNMNVKRMCIYTIDLMKIARNKDDVKSYDPIIEYYKHYEMLVKSGFNFSKNIIAKKITQKSYVKEKENSLANFLKKKYKDNIPHEFEGSFDVVDDVPKSGITTSVPEKRSPITIPNDVPNDVPNKVPEKPLLVNPENMDRNDYINLQFREKYLKYKQKYLELKKKP